MRTVNLGGRLVSQCPGLYRHRPLSYNPATPASDSVHLSATVHNPVQVVEVFGPLPGVSVPFADPGSSRTMTSAPPNASTSGGKSLNISSHSPLQQHQAQITSPSFDSSSRRSHQSSPVHINARNNQGSRKQHKNSRKPRFADEDEMAESVSHPVLT